MLGEDYFDDLAPDEEEVEEATGNCGATMDRCVPLLACSISACSCSCTPPQRLVTHDSCILHGHLRAPLPAGLIAWIICMSSADFAAMWHVARLASYLAEAL